MTFPIGTSVKVKSKCTLNGRTGVVIDDALKFPWRDYRKVQFDPKPPHMKDGIVPVVELETIKDSERDQSALPREQLGLFGSAA
jgi:hypothetical protein